MKKNNLIEQSNRNRKNFKKKIYKNGLYLKHYKI